MKPVKIDDDAYSSFGCNVATGIILESILMFRENNPKDKISKINTIFINGYTLYRNLIDCLEGHTLDKIKILKNDLGRVRVRKLFVEDTLKFFHALEEVGIETKIFLPSYKTPKEKFHNWLGEEELNPLKALITKTQHRALMELHSKVASLFRLTDYKFSHTNNLFIVTHLGLDLLNYTQYNNVVVVESHTGEFKRKDKWYTKLHKLGKNDLSILPFNEIIYRIFGDTWYVKHENIPLRKFIYKLALKKHWYYDMSNDDVLTSIKQEDQALYQELKRTIKPIY